MKNTSERKYSIVTWLKLSMSSLHDDIYALSRIAIRPDTDVSDLVDVLLAGWGPLVSSPFKQVRSKIRWDVRGINAQFQRHGMTSIRMGAKINYAK